MDIKRVAEAVLRGMDAMWSWLEYRLFDGGKTRREPIPIRVRRDD